MRKWGIAPIVLILSGAVACTSSGSDGATSGPASVGPSSAPAPTSSPAAPSTSATATPTVATTGPNVRPGEKPPELSPVAERNVNAGLDASTVFWLRALDWGYATTDSSIARARFGRSCNECARFAEIFDTTRRDGNHFIGGRLSLRMSEIVDDSRHRGARADDLYFDQQALSVVTSEGKILHHEAAHMNVRYRVWSIWNASSGWIVIDFKQVLTK